MFHAILLPTLAAAFKGARSAHLTVTPPTKNRAQDYWSRGNQTRTATLPRTGRGGGDTVLLRSNYYWYHRIIQNTAVQLSVSQPKRLDCAWILHVPVHCTEGSEGTPLLQQRNAVCANDDPEEHQQQYASHLK